MKDIFLAFLNVSIEASFIIGAFAVLRFLLKKCPAYIRCIIWAVVALRLIVPVSIESALSLMPGKIDFEEHNESVYIPDTNYPDIGYTENTGKPSVSVPDYTPPTEIVTPESTAPIVPDIDPTVPDTPIDTEITAPVTDGKAPYSTASVLFLVWLTGGLLMLCYIGCNFISTYFKIRNAAVYKDRIHITTLKTPFVFGIIKPRIYLPAGLDDKESALIIAHENAHIKRGDHISKIIAFLVLAVHWFNPFVWLAYALFCRDVEIACDEKIIKDMSHSERQAYSLALLNCTAGKKGAAYSLLAFGEVGTKERIKKVMNYKKPTVMAICIALVACLVLVSCFATRPEKSNGTDVSEDISADASTDASEDDHESSNEENTSNYARGCDYEVYRDGILIQNGPYYLNNYDDTGLVKLTDGIYDDTIFADGYGDTAKNAFYNDVYSLTIVVDLGEVHEEVGIVALKNVYLPKLDGREFEELDVLVYVSDDKVNYSYTSSYRSSFLIHETTKFVRKDNYFAFVTPQNCRYVKLTIRCDQRTFGLSELEVYPQEIPEIANIMWDVTNDRTLTIKGEGEMFIDIDEAPWKPFSSVVTKIVIEEGVTSIESYAFSQFNLVTEVIVPRTVKQIDAGAFYECSSLKSISLPDSITTIESSTFKNCLSLSSVKLPKGLINIKGEAFFNCEKLMEFELPETVAFIGDSAFYGCSQLKITALPQSLKSVGSSSFPENCFGEKLFIPKNLINIGDGAFGKQKHYEVDGENVAFASENGVLFNKDKSTLISYPVLKEAYRYTIPDGVVTISSYAFAQAGKLKQVSLSKSVETIENCAFQICSALEKVSLPETVKTIGKYAFSDCDALVKVDLPTKLTNISEGLFSHCNNLTEIFIPKDVTAIGDHAFSMCNNVVITTLPDSIEVIGNSAFEQCTKLKALLPKNLKSIGSQAFWFCDFDSIIIPEGVTDIGDCAFEMCRNAITVYLPSSLKKIYLGAFSGCTKLTQVSYGGTLDQWKAIRIDTFVDEWSNIDNIISAKVRCTDGTGGFMQIYSFEESGVFDKAGYSTYDGTIQGIVDALIRSSLPMYKFNTDIKVNSFRIENTAEADVQIAYIDLSDEFSTGFFEFPLRRNSLLSTLANTILATHAELDYNDMVQISVNGEIISDTNGTTLFKDYTHYVHPNPGLPEI